MAVLESELALRVAKLEARSIARDVEDDEWDSKVRSVLRDKNPKVKQADRIESALETLTSRWRSFEYLKNFQKKRAARINDPGGSLFCAIRFTGKGSLGCGATCGDYVLPLRFCLLNHHAVNRNLALHPAGLTLILYRNI